MNLGEEVILTLLWQSGASESATVCFVISLSISYWLFKCFARPVCQGCHSFMKTRFKDFFLAPFILYQAPIEFTRQHV